MKHKPKTLAEKKLAVRIEIGTIQDKLAFRHEEACRALRKYREAKK